MVCKTTPSTQNILDKELTTLLNDNMFVSPRDFYLCSIVIP